MTDDALAEILTLTREMDVYETIRWRNSDGQLHRVHGPAVIHHSGAQYWYMHGLKHRTDGPAVIWADGSRQWCLNGQVFTEEEWNERVKSM